MPDDANACRLCAIDGVSGQPAEEAYQVRGFRILRCPRCRLLWTQVGRDHDPDSVYTEAYFQGKIPDGYFDYIGSEAFLKQEYHARLSVIRAYQPQGHLLEVGCASGGFLQEARLYYQVQGIDVSEFAVRAARAKGLDVSCGHLETAGTLRPTYDVIVMFDTIEHLADPLSTLRAVHEHLRPSGSLFITTGDSRSILARLMRSRWRLMTPPQHLWFFDNRNIALMLERIGFAVVSSRHPWRLVPLTLIWYQLFRGKTRPLPRALARIVLPINLYDTMMIIAAKKEHSEPRA